MREAIELHDSKLLTVVETADSVTLAIDAYIVELHVDHGVVEELSCDLPWTIADGGIMGVVIHENLIPLPCEIDGDVCFTAIGCNDRSVKVRGTWVRIVPIGTARYIEETPFITDDASRNQAF